MAARSAGRQPHLAASALRQPVDFTLAAFARLCASAADVPALSLSQFLWAAPVPPFVILRFDVDYHEAFAIRLAAMLSVYRLRGTFYFRRHAQGFAWDTLQAIATLGHDIGYHYETLDRCAGDFERASELFLADISALRARGFPVETVAAHGTPPVAPGYRGNLDLLRAAPHLLGQAALQGDAMLSVDFTSLRYFSDAGWRWQRCDGTPPGIAPQRSALTALHACLAQPDAAVYINIHPHQWYARPGNACFYRWRNRLGMRIVPRLRAWERSIRRLGAALGAAACPPPPGIHS